MAGPLLMLLPALLVAVALAVAVLVVVTGAAGGRGSAPSAPAEAARRHAGVVHAVALACLLGALVGGPTVVAALPLTPAQGLYLGLVPATAGLAFAAVHVLGELTWPRPTGSVRRAPLVRRTTRDVAPRWLRRLTWVWAGLGVLALVACGVVATDDGRAVARALDGGSATSGPFPGWYFGVPLLVAVAVVLGAGEGGLRLVARRPVVTGAGPEWDLALRRLSAHRVLRGTQLVLAWTVAGVLAVAGSALRNVAGAATDGLGTVSGVHAAAGVAALLLGAAVGMAGLAVAVVPGVPARVRADAVDLRPASA